MAKRILVPLSGTPAGEAVLPFVADAARGAGATVRLLHVEPIPRSLVSESGRVVAYADQEMARLEAQWLNYLAGVEVTLRDIAVERVVRFGDPTPEILAEADAWEAELMAMTTAGRRRFRRIRRDGVAEAVFRKANIPVVLYGVR